MLQDFKVGRLCEPLSKRSWDQLEVTQQIMVSAERYRKYGLVRGDRVFIGYGNQLRFFADLLAVWRIGACAVPIDSRLTVFEIESLVLAMRPRLFVYTGDLDSNLTIALGKLGVIPIKTDRATQRETSGPIAFATADEHPLLDLGFPDPADAADLDQEALILFTSGSTPAIRRGWFTPIAH